MFFSKRKLASLFAVTVLLSIIVFPSTGFAATDSVENIVNNERVSTSVTAILANENGTLYSVKLYKQTTRLNKMTSSIMNAYADDSAYVDEYVCKLDSSNMTLAASSGDKSTQEWDQIGGDVLGTIKVYYYKSGSQYKVTRATGKFVSYNSGTGIRNKQYIIACNAGFSSNQYINSGFSTSSFDRTTNFSQYAESAGVCQIGACMGCEVYRIAAGSHWEFTIYCTIAGTLPDIPI